MCEKACWRFLILRYPQSLGCMHGGEGHSAMRSLLLRETVINESRNCSFMVRKKGGGTSSAVSFYFENGLAAFLSPVCGEGACMK